MSKKKALIILIFKYAFVINLLFLIISYVLIQMNKNPLISNSKIPFSFFLMPILFFGMDYEIKNYVFGGKTNFFKLFASNLALLSIFIVLSTSILYYLVSSYPELYEEYKTQSVLVLEQALQTNVEELGESKEKIAKNKDLLLSLTIFNWLGSEALKSSVIGVILAFLMSILLSRRKSKV